MFTYCEPFNYSPEQSLFFPEDRLKIFELCNEDLLCIGSNCQCNKIKTLVLAFSNPQLTYKDIFPEGEINFGVIKCIISLSYYNENFHVKNNIIKLLFEILYESGLYRYKKLNDTIINKIKEFKNGDHYKSNPEDLNWLDFYEDIFNVNTVDSVDDLSCFGKK